MIQRRSYLFLMAAVLVLDQLSKVAVVRSLDLHESYPVVEGLVALTHVQNRGAAFGILAEADLPHQDALFALVSVLAFGAIASYALRLPASSRMPLTGLALILGGALGNLVDRVRLGHVIDFLDVYWKRHHWPAFNVADSCITIGVTLLVLDMLLDRGSAPAGQDAPGGGLAEAGAGRTD